MGRVGAGVDYMQGSILCLLCNDAMCRSLLSWIATSFTIVAEVWHKIFDYPTEVTVQERLVEPPNYSQERIVQRLVDYHRHIGGIIQAYHSVYKTVNGDQPKSDVFSQGVYVIAVNHEPFESKSSNTNSWKSISARIFSQWTYTELCWTRHEVKTQCSAVASIWHQTSM